MGLKNVRQRMLCNELEMKWWCGRAQMSACSHSKSNRHFVKFLFDLFSCFLWFDYFNDFVFVFFHFSSLCDVGKRKYDFHCSGKVKWETERKRTKSKSEWNRLNDNVQCHKRFKAICNILFSDFILASIFTYFLVSFFFLIFFFLFVFKPALLTLLYVFSLFNVHLTAIFVSINHKPSDDNWQPFTLFFTFNITNSYIMENSVFKCLKWTLSKKCGS